MQPNSEYKLLKLLLEMKRVHSPDQEKRIHLCLRHNQKVHKKISDSLGSNTNENETTIQASPINRCSRIIKESLLQIIKTIEILQLSNKISTLYNRIVLPTSSHCIAVVSRWAIKIEVRLCAKVFNAFNIAASVVLSRALVASSHKLEYQKAQIQACHSIYFPQDIEKEINFTLLSCCRVNRQDESTLTLKL